MVYAVVATLILPTPRLSSAQSGASCRARLFVTNTKGDSRSTHGRIAATLILLLFLPDARAQAQAGKGTIQGHVTDSSGAVLQGASVMITPGGARAVTDAEGAYVVGALTAGDYTVSVTFIGFKEFSTTAHVAAGQPTRVDPRLDVAGQSESILVTAERPRGEEIGRASCR